MSDFRPESNCYSAMIQAVRTWIERDHPEAEYATVVVELGDDLPALTIPVIRQTEVISSQ